MARRRRWGQGTVRLKGNRFEATVRVKGIGRPRKSFEKESAAWDWIAAVKTDAARGTYQQEPARTKSLKFVDLCRLYRKHKISRWREGTLRFFDGHIKTMLKPHFGKRFIDRITPEEIQTFVDDQLKRVRASTVNLYIQVLRAVFNYAVRMRYLERSPVVGVERGRVEPREHRVLRPHELRAILEAAEVEYRPFFALLVFTGLRRAEAYRMRWDWLDFEDDMLHVKVAKRGSSKIPLAPYLKRALLALGTGLTGPVFCGRYRSNADQARAKEPKEITDLRKALGRALKAARVDPAGVAFHTFRRSFITLVERLPGVSYSVVRALARHGMSTTDITARYLYPAQDDLRRALALLEEQILGSANVVPLRQPAA